MSPRARTGSIAEENPDISVSNNRMSEDLRRYWECSEQARSVRVNSCQFALQISAIDVYNIVTKAKFKVGFIPKIDSSMGSNLAISHCRRSSTTLLLSASVNH